MLDKASSTLEHGWQATVGPSGACIWHKEESITCYPGRPAPNVSYEDLEDALAACAAVYANCDAVWQRPETNGRWQLRRGGSMEGEKTCDPEDPGCGECKQVRKAFACLDSRRVVKWEMLDATDHKFLGFCSASNERCVASERICKQRCDNDG